ASGATLSRMEAGKYSKQHRMIVLHFDTATIKDAPLLAEILNEHNYPAIAVSGGSPGMVELMVDGRLIKKYDQRALWDGTVGGIAMERYDIQVNGKTLDQLRQEGLEQ